MSSSLSRDRDIYNISKAKHLLQILITYFLELLSLEIAFCVITFLASLLKPPQL